MAEISLQYCTPLIFQSPFLNYFSPLLLCTIWHAVYFATVYLVSDAVGVFPANDDNPRGLAWDSPSKLEALGSSSGQSPFRATQSEFLG